MNIQTFYAVFDEPKWGIGIFGHVQVCGVTDDDDWFFYNPSKKGGDLDIVYRKEQVELYLAVTFSDRLVLRVKSVGPGTNPIMPLMSCASIAAHMLGFRAFTPWGLKRQLLRNGAEVITDGRTQRKQGSEGLAVARAADIRDGAGIDGSANLGRHDI